MSEQSSTDSGTPTAPTNRYQRLFQVPVLRHVLGAEAASKVGDWFTFVAASIIVFDLGGGKALGAFHIVRGLAPVVIGTRAGSLASRFHPVRLMIVADLVRAVLVASVGLLAALDVLTWPVALLLFSVAAAIGVVFRPAQMVVIARETPDELKPAINGILTVVQTGALSIGPILAGLAATHLGPAGLMWIDAATYTLSALLLVGALGFQDNRQPVPQGADKPSFRNVATSLLAIPRVRAPYVFHLTSHLVAGATFLLIVGIAQRFDDPDGQIGFLTGAVGVGSFIGAIAATRIATGSTRRVMAGATLALGPLLVLASSLQTWVLVAAAIFALGFMANLVEPFAWSEYQQAVPDKLMGASFGFIDATTTASILGASAIVGWLLDIADIGFIGAIAAVAVIAASTFGMTLLGPTRTSSPAPDAAGSGC
jgi:predicted MFS family arabinose efflux permease